MNAVLPGDYLTLHSIAKSNLPEKRKSGIMSMYEKMIAQDAPASSRPIQKASKTVVGGGSFALGLVLGALDEHVGLDVNVKGVKVPVDGVLGLATLLASDKFGEYEDHARLGGALGIFSAGMRKGREWTGGGKKETSTAKASGEDDDQDPIAKAAADL